MSYPQELQFWSIEKLQSEYKKQVLPVVCYGASITGKMMLSCLNSMNVPVAFFCDRDNKKTGKELEGIKILSLEELSQWQESKYIILTVAAKWMKSAFQTLQQYQVADTIIFMEVGSFYDKSIGKLCVWDLFLYSKSIPWYFYLAYNQIEEFSLDYVREVVDHFPNSVLKNGIMEMQDVSSLYVNVTAGERKTLPESELLTLSDSAQGQIYLYGDCVVFGYGVDDQHTIAGILQSNLLQENILLSVKNKGLAGFTDIKLLSDKILALDYTSSDVVILCLSSFNPLFAGIASEPTEAALLQFFYLQKISNHCRKTGTPFLYCINPALRQVKNRSAAEQFMMEHCFWSGMVEEYVNNLSIPLLESLCLSHGISCVNLNAYVQRPHEYGEVFIDPLHISPNGMRLVADVLCSYFASGKRFENVDLNAVQRYESRILQDIMQTQEEEDLNNYLYQLNQQKVQLPANANVGAVIMNCNPFTKGHLFLIEQALAQVDFLYIFVLEEDQSAFPFTARMDLVKKGTAHLKNIRVLPSGQYIISSVTFPEYFQKEQKQDAIIDCSKDLKTFCEKIAPILQITKRFVGTEPLCSVTNTYNKQMKKMLPAYGIEVVEIERSCVEIDGEQTPISASMVRKLIQAGQTQKLEAFLPKGTIDCILTYMRKS